jgi:8-oxo-dGTP diphosphatase
MTQKDNKGIRIAVDAVVFAYAKDAGISVLLIKRKYPPYKESWAIPGGFVLEEESLEDAVQRELLEETGIKVNYLEQLYTFGAPERDPRSRIISVAYFALVKSSLFQKLQASTDAEEAQWFSIKKLPVLAFDHKIILQAAIERVRAKVRYQPIGFELLDKKFSFPDLEKMYAALLDKALDRRNFTKKILSLGLLEDTGELAPAGGAGRPGKVYQFNKKRYQQLLKEGMHFEI